jgi:DNA-binding transcriptional LysR family regulator
VSIEIRHLRQFVMVAEEMHFTRAAERLHIAQPALSAQIKRLETELQVPLFERNTRVVRLTQHGATFLESARAVIDAWDAAMIVAGSMRKHEKTTVSLGIALRIDQRIRGEVKARLARIDPGVSVDFIAESSYRLVHDVAAGRIDAALCVAAVHVAGVRYHEVRQDPVVAVLPVGHPLSEQPSISLIDLKDDAWLVPSSRVIGTTAIMHELCRARGFEIRVSPFESADYDDEFRAVAEGRGIEVAPSLMVPRRQVDGVVFVPVVDATLPLEIAHLPSSSSPALQAAIRAVIEAGSTSATPTPVIAAH